MTESVADDRVAGAGARRRRPPQRRQVHAGQPDHRPPRGRRRGRPRGDPGPGVLRRELERPRLHRRRHRRLGPRRPRARRARSLPRPRSRSSVADAVLFVVDATIGITDIDEAVVKILRRAGKPVVLAANKVDDLRAEAEAAGLWNLGLGEPYPVSALHGRGSGDLLDAILDALPETPSMDDADAGRPAPGRHRRQAQRRQVVAAQQARQGGPRGRRRRGRYDGRPGRRARAARRPDLAVHRHRRHPQAGQGGVGPRVLRLAAHRRRDRAGRGRRHGGRRLAAADRAGPADHHLGRRDRPRAGDRVQQVGPGRRGAPLLPRPGDRARAGPGPVGAAGQHHRAHRAGTSTGWCRRWTRPSPAGRRRISTGQLNSFLGRLVAEHPHPVRGGKQPRILFGTQASTAPPTFVLFTSGHLEAGYVRFIERRLREEFGFVGSPIHLQVRPRKKNEKKGRR